MILADGILGQMMEPLVLHEYKPLSDLPSKQPWRLGDPSTKEPLLITSLVLDPGGMERRNFELQKKYERIAANETRYEEVGIDDADVIIVAYGTASRIARSAMEIARGEGIKVGLLRPISIWPYPSARLSELADRVEHLFVVEMSLGQMWEDVRLAVEGKAKVHLHGRTAGGIPDQNELVADLKKILSSKGDEIVRNF
jgi:2-oxoglutarate ferredoxin oxidoreductase subunit alpha